jgi:hypothetical protein
MTLLADGIRFRKPLFKVLINCSRERDCELRSHFPLKQFQDCVTNDGKHCMAKVFTKASRQRELQQIGLLIKQS